MGEIAEPEPAIGLGDGDAVEAEVAEFFPQVGREGVVNVNLRGTRRDFGGSEGSDAGAQHRDGFAMVEVEGGEHGEGLGLEEIGGKALCGGIVLLRKSLEIVESYRF